MVQEERLLIHVCYGVLKANLTHMILLYDVVFIVFLIYTGTPVGASLSYISFMFHALCV